MPSNNFIDHVRIFCRSGQGGHGMMHFHRDKFTTKGGPDGGDGGRGGHIILRGNRQMWTLLHLRYQKHVISGNGGNGGSAKKTGAQGEDRILEVPLGTVARDGESGEVLFEIIEDGEEKVLLKGGDGGRGNVHFKSATNQTPRYAEEGFPGQERLMILELKLLADVGLVGFPNAGKSTLLSVLSAAKPEIADYPFTTLTPNLGVVAYDDYRSFVMADIPGIIEGAHEGRGLGDRFLRHIERNAVLLFMISAENLDVPEEYQVISNELSQYDRGLIRKRKVLAVTKSDLLDEALKQQLRDNLPELPHIFISAVTGEGLKELKHLLWQMLNSEE